MTESGPDRSPNGAATDATQAAQTAQHMDPEVAAKIAELRSALRENFGKVVLAMMMVPRYRSQSLRDLQHLVLEPMLSDRLAIAYPEPKEDGVAPDMAGFAIWASVSEDVDARIREQIANGVFPVRLKQDEWNSGKINWLLDVVANDPKTVPNVIRNFRALAKEGDLRLHPVIARMIDAETLEKLGAKRAATPKNDQTAETD